MSWGEEAVQYRSTPYAYVAGATYITDRPAERSRGRNERLVGRRARETWWREG